MSANEMFDLTMRVAKLYGIEEVRETRRIADLSIPRFPILSANVYTRRLDAAHKKELRRRLTPQ